MPSKIPLASYMDEKLILFLDVKSQDAVLEKMVDALENQGRLKDKKQFLQAILDREKVISTGIGMGVAIPHAKLPNYPSFFLVMGILAQGVDWGALDGAPVRLVFLMGGPDDKQTEYLQILSALTLAIRSEDKRKKILQSSDPKEIISFFANI